jgi:hypothetical protein
MLISMPTGTSTIFGAFQAILPLLGVKPDELRPSYKLIQIEKFASGILPVVIVALDILRCTIFSDVRNGPSSNQ